MLLCISRHLDEVYDSEFHSLVTVKNFSQHLADSERESSPPKNQSGIGATHKICLQSATESWWWLVRL